MENVLGDDMPDPVGVELISSFAIILAGCLVILIDQTSKMLAMRLERGRFHALTGRVGLRLFTSKQAGYVQLSNWQAVGLWIVVVALIGLVLIFVKTPSIWGSLGLGLMLGGASSNLCDRFLRGSIVDFITLRGWRTFNLADAAMVAGVALLWTLL